MYQSDDGRVIDAWSNAFEDKEALVQLVERRSTDHPIADYLYPRPCYSLDRQGEQMSLGFYIREEKVFIYIREEKAFIREEKRRATAGEWVYNILIEEPILEEQGFI